MCGTVVKDVIGSVNFVVAVGMAFGFGMVVGGSNEYAPAIGVIILFFGSPYGFAEAVWSLWLMWRTNKHC